MRIPQLPTALVALAALSCQLEAQAPGVPVESPVPQSQDRALLDRLAALRESGRGLDTTAAKAALEKPAPEAVELPPCRTTPLRPAEVWQAAQRSRLWVGWHFLCHKCEHWHVNLAGGYPVTNDGAVITCYHVAEPGAEIKEGRLVAVDGEGKVYPVTGVLARSRTMDACLLRVEGLKIEPLPLNDQIRPGDPAYLLSSPLNVSGYFSDGMVNRFFWNTPRPGSDELKHLRMHVSTDWAPGSSGSPLLDTCGNAISHVATIAHLGDGRNTDGKGVAHLTLHEAIPARSVRWLIRQAAEAASGPAAPGIPAFSQVQEALEAGDHVRAAALADGLEKSGTPEADKPRLAFARFLIAAGRKDEAGAARCAARLVEEFFKDDGPALNEAAWKLVTVFPAPQPDTLATAEKVARRSVDLHAHRDPASLDTLARVCFLQDRKEEAVKLQEEAVNLAEAGLRTQLEKTLAEYRAGKLPEAKAE